MSIIITNISYISDQITDIYNIHVTFKNVLHEIPTQVWKSVESPMQLPLTAAAIGFWQLRDVEQVDQPDQDVQPRAPENVSLYSLFGENSVRVWHNIFR